MRVQSYATPRDYSRMDISHSSQRNIDKMSDSSFAVRILSGMASMTSIVKKVRLPQYLSGSVMIFN